MNKKSKTLVCIKLALSLQDKNKKATLNRKNFVSRAKIISVKHLDCVISINLSIKSKHLIILSLLISSLKMSKVIQCSIDKRIMKIKSLTILIKISKVKALKENES